MKRWLYALPAAGLILIAGFATSQLMRGDKGAFERVSREAPAHVFPLMQGGEISFAPPPGDEAVIVNLFASWCAPCVAEHPLLTELGARHPGRVYGVLYRDTREAGQAFLDRLGNPYTAIALDPEGRGGLDFGLTGVPETFVVSADGKILLHVAGPLDEVSTQKISEALAAPRS